MRSFSLRSFVVAACLAAAGLATGRASCAEPSSAAPPSAPPPKLESARVLRAKLAASGRAEVNVVHTLADDMGGSPPRHARLALEPPDRVRLEFADDGECLTMRGDGGEWLQPSAHQLLLLPAGQIEVGARLWNVLLAGSGPWKETREAKGRYAIVPETGPTDDPAPFTKLTIVLGSDGLPLRLTAINGNQQLELRFSGWRFTNPRGQSAFRLVAPAGVTTVPLR